MMDDRGKATHARFTSESQITPPPPPQGILGGHGGDDCFVTISIYKEPVKSFVGMFRKMKISLNDN